jgi:hypothetical protein
MNIAAGFALQAANLTLANADQAIDQIPRDKSCRPRPDQTPGRSTKPSALPLLSSSWRWLSPQRSRPDRECGKIRRVRRRPRSSRH